MRLALLGTDDEIMLLAQAAEQSGRHELLWACDAGKHADELRKLSRSVVLADDWQQLLEQPNIDVVVVATSADDDGLAERLRVLAQTDVALLVSHPASDSPLFYHELDMIRQDTGVTLMPLVAERWHPYIVELSRQLPSQPKIKIEQVTLERTLPLRDKSHVMRQFMQDVCVLRAVCGELDRVSALPAADADSTFANLGVQMTGSAAFPIRWSVAPVIDEPCGRLTIATDAEPIRIEMVENPSDWRVSDPGRRLRGVGLFKPFAAQTNVLDALEDRIENTNHSIPHAPREENHHAEREGYGARRTSCDWSEACRSVELADAVEQSLRRGRAIQLHDEVYTEAGVFKGLMGMAGCGLLLLGLVIVVLGTTGGALLKRLGFDRAADRVGWWPYALLAIFVAFLLMQLLRLVVPVAGRDKRSEDE